MPNGNENKVERPAPENREGLMRGLLFAALPLTLIGAVVPAIGWFGMAAGLLLTFIGAGQGWFGGNTEAPGGSEDQSRTGGAPGRTGPGGDTPGAGVAPDGPGKDKGSKVTSDPGAGTNPAAGAGNEKADNSTPAQSALGWGVFGLLGLAANAVRSSALSYTRGVGGHAASQKAGRWWSGGMRLFGDVPNEMDLSGRNGRFFNLGRRGSAGWRQAAAVDAFNHQRGNPFRQVIADDGSVIQYRNGHEYQARLQLASSDPALRPLAQEGSPLRQALDKAAENPATREQLNRMKPAQLAEMANRYAGLTEPQVARAAAEIAVEARAGGALADAPAAVRSNVNAALASMVEAGGESRAAAEHLLDHPKKLRAAAAEMAEHHEGGKKVGVPDAETVLKKAAPAPKASVSTAPVPAADPAGAAKPAGVPAPDAAGARSATPTTSTPSAPSAEATLARQIADVLPDTPGRSQMATDLAKTVIDVANSNDPNVSDAQKDAARQVRDSYKDGRGKGLADQALRNAAADLEAARANGSADHSTLRNQLEVRLGEQNRLAAGKPRPATAVDSTTGTRTAGATVRPASPATSTGTTPVEPTNPAKGGAFGPLLAAAGIFLGLKDTYKAYKAGSEEVTVASQALAKAQELLAKAEAEKNQQSIAQAQATIEEANAKLAKAKRDRLAAVAAPATLTAAMAPVGVAEVMQVAGKTNGFTRAMSPIGGKVIPGAVVALGAYGVATEANKDSGDRDTGTLISHGVTTGAGVAMFTPVGPAVGAGMVIYHVTDFAADTAGIFAEQRKAAKEITNLGRQGAALERTRQHAQAPRLELPNHDSVGLLMVDMLSPQTGHYPNLTQALVDVRAASADGSVSAPTTNDAIKATLIKLRDEQKEKMQGFRARLAERVVWNTAKIDDLLDESTRGQQLKNIDTEELCKHGWYIVGLFTREDKAYNVGTLLGAYDGMYNKYKLYEKALVELGAQEKAEVGTRRVVTQERFEDPETRTSGAYEKLQRVKDYAGFQQAGMTLTARSEAYARMKADPKLGVLLTQLEELRTQAGQDVNKRKELEQKAQELSATFFAAQIEELRQVAVNHKAGKSRLTSDEQLRYNVAHARSLGVPEPLIPMLYLTPENVHNLKAGMTYAGKFVTNADGSPVMVPVDATQEFGVSAHVDRRVAAQEALSSFVASQQVKLRQYTSGWERKVDDEATEVVISSFKPINTSLLGIPQTTPDAKVKVDDLKAMFAEMGVASKLEPGGLVVKLSALSGAGIGTTSLLAAQTEAVATRAPGLGTYPLTGQSGLFTLPTNPPAGIQFADAVFPPVTTPQFLSNEVLKKADGSLVLHKVSPEVLAVFDKLGYPLGSPLALKGNQLELVLRPKEEGAQVFKVSATYHEATDSFSVRQIEAKKAQTDEAGYIMPVKDLHFSLSGPESLARIVTTAKKRLNDKIAGGQAHLAAATQLKLGEYFERNDAAFAAFKQHPLYEAYAKDRDRYFQAKIAYDVCAKEHTGNDWLAATMRGDACGKHQEAAKSALAHMGEMLRNIALQNQAKRKQLEKYTQAFSTDAQKKLTEQTSALAVPYHDTIKKLQAAKVGDEHYLRLLMDATQAEGAYLTRWRSLASETIVRDALAAGKDRAVHFSHQHQHYATVPATALPAELSKEEIHAAFKASGMASVQVDKHGDWVVKAEEYGAALAKFAPVGAPAPKKETPAVNLALVSARVDEVETEEAFEKRQRTQGAAKRNPDFFASEMHVINVPGRYAKLSLADNVSEKEVKAVEEGLSGKGLYVGREGKTLYLSKEQMEKNFQQNGDSITLKIGEAQVVSLQGVLHNEFAFGGKPAEPARASTVTVDAKKAAEAAVLAGVATSPLNAPLLAAPMLVPQPQTVAQAPAAPK